MDRDTYSDDDIVFKPGFSNFSFFTGLKPPSMKAKTILIYLTVISAVIFVLIAVFANQERGGGYPMPSGLIMLVSGLIAVVSFFALMISLLVRAIRE
jgi:hypothetical protein